MIKHQMLVFLIARNLENAARTLNCKKKESRDGETGLFDCGILGTK